MREFWTGLASLMGVFAFCQTLFSTLFPPELRYSVMKSISRVSNYFSSYCYFDITEIDGVNTNELYNAVQLYLSTAVAGSSRRLSITRALNSSGITFGLSSNDVITDTFNGVAVQWEHIVLQRNNQSFTWRPLPEEKRGFTLRVRKDHKGVLLNAYLDHIMERSAEIRRKNEDRYLYTNSRGGSLDSRGPQPWEAVPFKHPSTFDTLAMDPRKKTEIMADLREFASGQAFYQKTGRAWKRGYLLYGQPGTGKSSMIAAMANYLGYDIYDLELTEVNSNSELRKLLMKTTSKSIIVIEDIDCSITLANRDGANDDGTIGNNKIVKKGNNTNNNTRGMMLSGHHHHHHPPGGGGGGDVDGNGTGSGSGNSVTLSGLLNFTDGLWSCCGSERIFVFTTNHIDRLDPALLRSGRMDMHIHMSYCGVEGLRILLGNYLQGDRKWCPEDEDDGELSGVIKQVEEIVDQAEITPADVSEVLLRNRRVRGMAVRELLEETRRRVEINNNNNKKRPSSSSLSKDLNNGEDGDLDENEEARVGNGGDEYAYQNGAPPPPPLENGVVRQRNRRPE